jgi:hypothetical protein
LGTLLFCDGCLRLRLVVTRTGLVWLGPLKGLKICSPFWMPSFLLSSLSAVSHFLGAYRHHWRDMQCVGIRRQSLRFARLLRRTDFPFCVFQRERDQCFWEPLMLPNKQTYEISFQARAVIWNVCVLFVWNPQNSCWCAHATHTHTHQSVYIIYNNDNRQQNKLCVPTTSRRGIDC